ncbi:MAG TPA: ZIP family metal transporter [Patescibacteria group bacterium]|nr:ZIP family metal transporter [Patescibacteria group bacterium]
MTFEQTVLLSAFAGLTIFLGLPVGRLRNLSTRSQALLTTAAAGVILFLIWDILAQAVEPVEASLEAASSGEAPVNDFVVNVTAFGLSIAVGLLSLVWLTGEIRNRRTVAVSAHDIALGTAVGLGLHNFSEGLAIGQSAVTGATSFALILAVGFALHNATEGFGIAAPLTTGERPTWAFLGLLGLIGGGPTFAGGVIGYSFTSPLLSIIFLGVAAGALIFVFNEMMATARRFALPAASNVALLAGLLVAFGTDFLLVAVGS